VLTPPLAAGILEGVTRGVVLALARAAAVPVEERPLTAADLEGADELFITSTVREILPVTRLGERAVADGRPGPLTHALHRKFRKHAGGPVSIEG
jgi:branched-chain amino acid aminotransferase